MSNAEFGSLIFELCLLLTTAHLLGWLFGRMRQPPVVGEILAGVLLGPSILGHFAPAISKAIFASGSGTAPPSGHGTVLSFLYNLGLLLLMFVSAAETPGFFTPHDRRAAAPLWRVVTGLPFLLVLPP